MVSTTDVKRALRALALRTETTTRPYTAVIDEGDAARDDLRRAAGFVDAVGLDRLEAAVDAATEAGDVDCAERGREALSAYRRFCAAARSSTSAPASVEMPHAGVTSADRRSDDVPRYRSPKPLHDPGTTKTPTSERSEQ